MDDRAGHWAVHPKAPFQSSQRYAERTNVLETHFATATGKLVLTDHMPVASEEEKLRVMMADHEAASPA